MPGGLGIAFGRRLMLLIRDNATIEYINVFNAEVGEERMKPPP